MMTGDSIPSKAAADQIRSPGGTVWLARLSMLAGLACALVAQADSVHFHGAIGAFRVPVKSLKEMRWDSVVRQRYDFSCGAAAVATLLSFHYDRPTTEEQVFRIMFARGDQDKIRAYGFSMLNMKLYLDEQGLRSDGFRLTLAKFARVGVPGITVLSTHGYRHFVVVKGIENDRVLVADPALGTRVIPRAVFEQEWNGAVLAARESMQLARQHFNRVEDWRVRARAPVQDGLERPTALGSFGLTLPSGLQEFGR